jgi:hypothetical protein
MPGGNHKKDCTVSEGGQRAIVPAGTPDWIPQEHYRPANGERNTTIFSPLAWREKCSIAAAANCGETLRSILRGDGSSRSGRTSCKSPATTRD